MNRQRQTFGIVFWSALLLPCVAVAANLACPGKQGGVARCDDAKYLCKDGSYDKTEKKPCNLRELLPSPQTTPPPVRKAQPHPTPEPERASGGRKPPQRKPH